MHRPLLVALACLSASAFAQVSAPPAAEPENSEKVVLETLKVTTTIGNYAESTASTATKMPMNIRDVPATVQVLNSSFIGDSRAQTLEALYPYVVGMQREGNGSTDYNLRGFSSFGAGPTARSMQVDGMPGLTTKFGSPNTVNIDRVEVLKGPASLLYDLITPGGMINLVTKRPQERAQVNVVGTTVTYYGNTQSFAENMGYTLSVDATGPIDQGKHLLYRMIVKGDDINSWRKYTYAKNFYLYPSLSYVWNKDTSLTAQVEVLREKRLSDFTALITPNNNAATVSPKYDTVYAEPGDTDRDMGEAVSFNFDHNFTNGWVLHASERSTYAVNTRRGYDANTIILASPIENSTLRRTYRWNDNRYRVHYFDANVHGDLPAKGFKQTLLVGASASSDWSDSRRLALGPTVPVINIYSPDIGTLVGFPPAGTGPFNPKVMLYNYSAYFSDHLAFGRWKPSFGVRYDRQQGNYLEVVANRRNTEDYGHFIPNAALMYEASERLSLYTSYAESFIPNNMNAVDINNNSFPPETSWQFEVGAKADFLDKKLNVTLSAYTIDKSNVLENVPAPAVNVAGLSYAVLNGLVRSQGLELQASWHPLPYWQVEGGVSYIPVAKTVESVIPANVGLRTVEVSKLTTSFWTRYNVPTGALRGFGVGLGVLYTSPHFSTTKNIAIAGRTLVNPAFYYQWKAQTLALNIDNLFDVKYLTSRSQNGLGIQPGAPRRFTLSYSLHFN